MPILQSWDTALPEDFPNYSAGTWGPEEAVAFIAQDGRNWVTPSIEELSETESGCQKKKSL
jgi:glucose-6-phosphate 1-dehydrogenase